MSHQVALTIMAGVKPGKTEALKQVLTSMNNDPANNDNIPFGRLARVLATWDIRSGKRPT